MKIISRAIIFTIFSWGEFNSYGMDITPSIKNFPCSESGYYPNTAPRVLPQWAIQKWQSLVNLEDGSNIDDSTCQDRKELILAFEENDIEALYAIGLKFRNLYYGDSAKESEDYYKNTEPFFWNSGIRGHTKAMHNFALLRFKQKDYLSAYEWFLKAEMSFPEGFIPSKNNRQRLERNPNFCLQDILEIREKCKKHPLPQPLSIEFISGICGMNGDSICHNRTELINYYIRYIFLKTPINEHLKLIEENHINNNIIKEFSNNYKKFQKGSVQSLVTAASNLMFSKIEYPNHHLSYDFQNKTFLTTPGTVMRQAYQFEKVVGYFLLQKAAVLGNCDAMIELAKSMVHLSPRLNEMHRCGSTIWLNENRPIAIYWLNVAEANCSPENISALQVINYNRGYILELGNANNPYIFGIPRDFKIREINYADRSERINSVAKALPYYIEASHLNDIFSKFKIANLYDEGDIVKEDPEFAFVLYCQIIKYSDRFSAGWMDIIRERMSWMFHIGRGTERDENAADFLYSNIHIYYDKNKCEKVRIAALLTLGNSSSQDFIEAENLISQYNSEDHYLGASFSYIADKLTSFLTQRSRVASPHYWGPAL